MKQPVFLAFIHCLFWKKYFYKDCGGLHVCTLYSKVMDCLNSQAASRRSHEGGYDYSSSRYEYGSDKSSYSNEDRGRPVYREDRRPSADRRDEYHSPRSREPSGSSMPPPSVPVRGTAYRTRAGIRGRGITRVYTRRPTDVSLAARKRSLIETYAAKRRILTGRTQDYFKKLKSIKLRR